MHGFFEKSAPQRSAMWLQDDLWIRWRKKVEFQNENTQITPILRQVGASKIL